MCYFTSNEAIKISIFIPVSMCFNLPSYLIYSYCLTAQDYAGSHSTHASATICPIADWYQVTTTQVHTLASLYNRLLVHETLCRLHRFSSFLSLLLSLLLYTSVLASLFSTLFFFGIVYFLMAPVAFANSTSFLYSL